MLYLQWPGFTSVYETQQIIWLLPEAQKVGSIFVTWKCKKHNSVHNFAGWVSRTACSTCRGSLLSAWSVCTLAT